MENRDIWIKKIKKFIPEFMDRHPVLRDFRDRATIILHGSITLGFDDPFSDIDLWLLIPEIELNNLDKVSESRFFEIEVDGKPGHLNAESIEDFSKRFHHLKNHNDNWDTDIIYQLRNAEVLLDNAEIGQGLILLAKKPMRKEVRDSFFFYHYVEMRTEHRASDNPMERHDPVGIFLSLPKVIAHALRAAMVLDSEPYPYDKWLYFASSKTSTGEKLIPSINKILDLLASNKLRFEGSEAENPISQELRIMRKILIENAIAKGIDTPWLYEWWLFMTQARDNMNGITW